VEELTIAQQLKGKLPRLKLLEQQIAEYEELYPFTPQYKVVDKATYLGIECEIENLYETVSRPVYWNITEDGSLRNHGYEFVSHPIRASSAEQALTDLFRAIARYNTAHYTERTSTHIHVNVRTLTLSQLESLVLTYMVFERAIYKWIGHDRENNIFCVPLHSIHLTNNLCSSLQNIEALHWTKYTGLNLAPILQKGTIEFRHLYGTNDVGTIMTWINLLLSLKKYALRNNPVDVIARINTLNNVSDYYGFCQEVFGDYAQMLHYSKFNTDVSKCVSNIKARCFRNVFGNNVRTDFMNSKFGMFVRSKVGKVGYAPGQLNPAAMRNFFAEVEPNFDEGRIEEEDTPEEINWGTTIRNGPMTLGAYLQQEGLVNTAVPPPPPREWRPIFTGNREVDDALNQIRVNAITGTI
jgi:hypothetical protein